MSNGILFFLQAGGSGAAGLLAQLFPFIAIFGIFYLLVIAPQRKEQQARQQKLEEMLSNLKSGDKVVTVGGLLGTVMSVNTKENTVQLQIAPSVRVEVVRNAITALQDEKEEK